MVILNVVIIVRSTTAINNVTVTIVMVPRVAMRSRDTTDGGVVDVSKEANHLFSAIQVTMTIVVNVVQY